MDVNVDEELNDSPIGPFHVLVVVLCGLVVLIDGYDLVVMGLAIPSMSMPFILLASATALFRLHNVLMETGGKL